MNDVKTIADMQAQIDTLRGMLANLEFLLEGHDVDILLLSELNERDIKMYNDIRNRIIKLLELEEAKRYGIGQ